jgi:hypothetical protein
MMKQRRVLRRILATRRLTRGMQVRSCQWRGTNTELREALLCSALRRCPALRYTVDRHRLPDAE